MHRVVVVACLCVVVACEGGSAEGEGEGEVPELPASVCTAPLTARSSDDVAIVGDGTAASCTAAALRAAMTSTAAMVRFSCGDDAVTIDAGEELVVERDLIVDGGGRVTLSGGGAHRIMRLASSFERDAPTLTVQGLTFVDGNSPGDGSDTVQGGGAIFRIGGSLEVIDCAFVDNVAPIVGQDVAGGAISSIGGGDTTIVGSVFANNRASNGGALGNLGNGLVVVNSSFDGDAATGNGGNPGNGGNGGAISVDGENRNVELCGVRFTNHRANAFGGAFFRVAYHGEPTTMHHVVVQDAGIDDRDPSMAGGVYVQNSAFVLSSSSIVGNRARAAGGVYVGPGSTIRFDNVSFLDNVASSSLAGAVFLDGVVGGEVTFSSFIGNAAPGAVAFGGAVTGDASRITLKSSLFIDNVAGNGFNPITCTTRFLDGSDSFQFPVVRAGNGGGDGGSDDPGALCAPDITVLDVDVAARDDAGIVPVQRPAIGSGAIGVVDDGCALDALGAARPTPCSAGAVEPVDG